MDAFTNRDFAAFLDEAIAAADIEQPQASRPSFNVDVLAVTPDGRPIPADPIAGADYLFTTLEDAIEPPPLASEPPPSTDPMLVALELGLTGREACDDLDRIRRDFAFANHPDRVAEDLRDVAMVRMQLVNRMIDDAKARAVR